jgi:hypothetical protein
MPMTVLVELYLPRALCEAARTWLHSEAEVVDTTDLTPAEAAQRIADAVKG